MRTHTYIRRIRRRSRGLESSGQVVKRKNCTRSRGQGSFSAVKNLDRGRKRSYGKLRSDLTHSALFTCTLHCHVTDKLSHVTERGRGPPKAGPTEL